MKVFCKCLLLLLLPLFSGVLHAQDYPAFLIPPDLMPNANGVVRYRECTFIVEDLNHATEKVVEVVTVFNEYGKDLSEVTLYQDKFHELKSFSGEIYLASGKVFKKIGKGDLQTTAYSPYLATDGSASYYTCSAPSYPYTVKYTYEIKLNNGVPSLPGFSPVPSFACSVQKSVHRIQFPASMPIRYKSNSLAPEPQRSLVNKDSLYVWESENLKAISWEPRCPSLSELAPRVMPELADFCFDKACGNMSTWKNTGLFLSQLQQQRDILSPETIAKMKELTASAKDDKEKVKILYEYLQNKTRYVAILLGIGGWQPLPASEVDKSGFGDCKALSNYMLALLSAVGIRSEYAIVDTKKKKMFKDFSTLLGQANHVILMVPLPKDTVWLECTSRKLPFNYAHSDIAGHDVLLVSGEKSALCTVREIPDSLNTETNVISMTLHPDATMTSSVKNIYKNHSMESYLNFVLDMPEKDRLNALAEELSVDKPQISKIRTDFVKTEHPEITIAYDMEAQNFANKTGNRLFVNVNPFRSRWSQLFSSNKRVLPIRIRSGVYQTDSIRIQLPEGFVVESQPKPVSLRSDFGVFSSSVETEGKQLVFIQKIVIPIGNYEAERYEELKDFLKQIDAALAGRIVLKKE